jgi:hypothetical protein
MEVRKVSRKTSADGKIEISPRLATSIEEISVGLTIVLDGKRGRGRITSLTCSCGGAGTDGEHVHHFLESDLFRELPPEQDVLVEVIRDAATVLVSPR